ncbi:MAG TPA: hypothetical protein VER17_11850, partial [Tepidisphaeraceae bacterium]|nr:hypothetical protein [Tepidisphaeraceae bacterium]
MSIGIGSRRGQRFLGPSGPQQQVPQRVRVQPLPTVRRRRCAEPLQRFGRPTVVEQRVGELDLHGDHPRPHRPRRPQVLQPLGSATR